MPRRQIGRLTYIFDRHMTLGNRHSMATHEIMTPKVMRDPSININAPRFAADESSA